MGCDIHCYIEYSEYKGSWWGFGGRINPGRDYDIFARLAGVRNYGDEIKTPIPPRGVPADMSYEAMGDYALLLSDDGEPDMEGHVHKSTAKLWYGNNPEKYLIRNRMPYAVVHPDWHSHSWMTLDEFESTIKEYLDGNAIYLAMIAAMRAMESNGVKTRIIFWFDN